jgi:nitrite reductase/ring-hydroxylating ferredoxin subunit
MPGPDTAPIPDGFLRAGSLDELKARGKLVVRRGRCPLLVVADGERVFAVDNRCPHLGFPLDRGSVEDGILTCHWHHARFDLASGGGFDLWADDLPTAEVRIADGDVWVCAEARYADGAAHWQNRLRAGLEHNIHLVIAKAILGLTAQGTDPRELVREAALFGVRHRDSWSTGLTILTALANLLPDLPAEDAYLALYKGITRVAADCQDQAARRDGAPLDTAPPLPMLTRWLRHWTSVRHRDGAERTLRTAIAAGATPAGLAEMMLVAVTDRVFADGGHALDFINKAFECLDRVGWQHAASVLPATVEHLVATRGAEESTSWRHPVDLVALCADAAAELPGALAAGAPHRGPVAQGEERAAAALADELLGDEPKAIVAALLAALRAGATPADLGQALAYAAALRVARFGTANEHSDWEAAHHAFTYAHALHRLVARIDPERAAPEALRGILHSAMRVYLLRFLNVPPARLPGDDARLDDLPEDAAALRTAFLATLDRHGAIDEAARLVARYLMLGHERRALVATLAQATLREDAGFHAYQMLEAAVAEAGGWRDAAPGRHILIAAARYLAAHAPSERGELQTANVARKLARGQTLHDGES